MIENEPQDAASNDTPPDSDELTLHRLQLAIDNPSQLLDERFTTLKSDYDACITALTNSSWSLSRLPSTDWGHRQENLYAAYPGLIGVGSYGLVFSVTKAQDFHTFACKLLRPSKQQNIDAVNRFKAEGDVTSDLKHEGIIQVIETGVIGDIHYILYPASPIGSLDIWLSGNENELSLPQITWLTRQIADAIQHAHSELTLHRDIKPGNILLFHSPKSETYGLGFRPLLGDFGLSKKLTKPLSSSAQFSTSGIIGTPRYMAPEQAKGDREAIRTTADIYALGIILSELIAGSRERKLQQSRFSVYRSVKRRRPTELELVAKKCTATEPKQRYQTAQELSNDLTCILRGLSTSVSPLDPVSQCISFARRNPLRILTALTMILLTVTYIISLRMAWQRERILGITLQNQLLEISELETTTSLAKSQLVKSSIQATSFYEKAILGQKVSTEEMQSAINPIVDFLKVEVSKASLDLDAGRLLSVLYHYLSLAEMMSANGKSAIDYRLEALKLQERLIATNPSNSKLRFQRATSLYYLSVLSSPPYQMGNSQTIAYLLELIDALNYMLHDAPESADVSDMRNAAYVTLGKTYHQLSDFEKATSAFRRAENDSKELIKKFPNHPRVRMFSAYETQSLIGIWRAHLAAGRTIEAMELAASVKELVSAYFGDLSDQDWAIGTKMDGMFPMIITCLRIGDYEGAKNALDVFHRDNHVALWEAGYSTASERNLKILRYRTLQLLCEYHSQGDMNELWAIEDHFFSSLLESLSNGTVGVNIIEEILEDTQLFDERITDRIDYLKSAVGTR